jgi:hypothetical protein
MNKLMTVMFILFVTSLLAVAGEQITPERLKELPEIAFVVQAPLGNPDGVVRLASRPIVKKWGCSIEVYNPAKPEKPARNIYTNRAGAILDMNLSYDAKTLFFTMREGYEDSWHVYEIGTDGSGFKQLSFGEYHDLAPAEMPNGRLVFVSSRIKSFNVCAQEFSTALFSMDRDGKDIRQITVNTLNDMSPQILPNGQIIYMRWEYVDRDVKWRQSLWTVNPDGTNVQLYFGNTVRDPCVMWQARPIPGRSEVVCAFTPHHGWPYGAIGTVTNRHGVETKRGVGYKWVTKEYPKIGDNAGLPQWAYRDPFPVSESEYLVSYGGGLKGPNGKFKIYLLNEDDQKSLLWEDKTLSCTYPTPLSSLKRPPVHHSQNEWPEGVTTGTFLLQDVYIGMGDSVKRGEIKALRIMEQIAKFPENETDFPRNRVYEMTPVMGRRCYYNKRCLGTVPVEEDGSAHFTVPAFRELYFQALDENGMAIQSMGSATNLVPGESQTCIGCHEDRQMAPLHKMPIAAKKKAVKPTPYEWGNEGTFDFTKIVQPVLDKHCVKCHSGEKPKGKLNLSGDKTRFFNMAYDNLYNRRLIYAIVLTNNDGQVIAPKKSFAYVSKIRDFIEGKHPKHTEIKLTKEERERFYVWIDSNSNYYGTHKRTRPGTPGGRDLWAETWFKKDFMGVFKKSCISCHENFGTLWYPKDTSWINLTNPEQSLALTAHLSKEAGGYGMNAEKDGKRPPAYKSVNDADLQTMLKAIQQGKRDMISKPRMDMPGAVPKRSPGDWGSYRGTGDPADKAPGNFWDTISK